MSLGSLSLTPLHVLDRSAKGGVVKTLQWFILILILSAIPVFATVTVTSPAPGSTVTSPVQYTAIATSSTCAKGVSSMGIYLSNKQVYSSHGANQINTQLILSPGYQHTVVEEWDHCGKASYTTINITVKPSAPPTVTSIAVSPSPASVATGATQQFIATATYSDGSTGNVTAAASWQSANAAAATISSAGLATGLASGSTTVTATLSGVSGSAPLTVTPAVPPGAGANVVTWHFDNQRSGLNAGEESLSPANVTAQTFGKLFSYVVDGYVYGEPLLVSNLTINGTAHNVLYVATEHDSVYAFDADSYGDGTPLWQVSLLGSGETPLHGSVIAPWRGVTSTPVIDLASNTLYAVSTQTLTSGKTTFRLNAIDITTGAQKLGSPVTIQASVPGTNSSAVNGVVSLTASSLQRTALLLADGNVYIGFGRAESGWLLGYDAQTLKQTGVFNATPNLNGEGKYPGGGGIWMGSGGPAADSAGNIYITTGDGPWDGQTAWSDSVLKFNSQLQMQDYFTPADYQFMNCNDADLAGGGLLLIPGTTEALAAGKTGKLYLVDTTNPGKEQANDAGAIQTLWFESDLVPLHSASCTDVSGTHTTQEDSSETYGTAAYFNGSVYIGVTPTSTTARAYTRQFVYSGGTLTPGSYTSDTIQKDTPGTTPFISANGTTNGVLWMIDEGQPIQNSSSKPPTHATLRAYDANDLSHELYNSGLNSGDVPGYGIKFSSPIVGNGKAYISTGYDLVTAQNPRGEVDVYGLK